MKTLLMVAVLSLSVYQLTPAQAQESDGVGYRDGAVQDIYSSSKQAECENERNVARSAYRQASAKRLKTLACNQLQEKISKIVLRFEAALSGRSDHLLSSIELENRVRNSLWDQIAIRGLQPEVRITTHYEYGGFEADFIENTPDGPAGMFYKYDTETHSGRIFLGRSCSDNSLESMLIPENEYITIRLVQFGCSLTREEQAVAFITSGTAPQITNVLLQGDSDCPDHRIQYYSNNKFFPDWECRMNYDEAQNYCHKKGTRLPSIYEFALIGRNNGELMSEVSHGSGSDRVTPTEGPRFWYSHVINLTDNGRWSSSKMKGTNDSVAYTSVHSTYGETIDIQRITERSVGEVVCIAPKKR